jgi:predicted metal-dependent hydrolase
MADLPAYTLVSSRRRRSVAIMVDPERGVVIYAPHNVGRRFLAGLLRERRGWIERKLAELAARRAEPKFRYDGTLADAAWLINERAAHYARLMGLAPNRVAVKDQRRRWGSCSARTGAVHFNWRLVMAPPEVLDYVVVHELAHLAQPDHSRAFWALVAQYAPAYKACRKWLREHGAQLVL